MMPCALRWSGPAWCAAALVAVPACSGVAQASGSTASAVVGGALGAYSGVFLGMVGATIPCSQTTRPVRCLHVSAGVTAVSASVSGAVLGSADEDRIWQASRNAGIGAAVGAIAAVGLSQVSQRVGIGDVGALGLLGGAVGAAPRGAAIGLAVGSGLGLTLMVVTDLRLPDAVGFAAAGVAIGGLAQWILDAHAARSAVGGPTLTLAALRLAL
jgi:hypothetical protein